MQGLGNDFFVFDAASLGAASIDAGKLRGLADRHTGVGFDQALMLEAPRDARSRVYYRVFNSDGGEVEQCGNGARVSPLSCTQGHHSSDARSTWGRPPGRCMRECGRTVWCRWTWASPNSTPVPFRWMRRRSGLVRLECRGRGREHRRRVHRQPPCGAVRRGHRGRAGCEARSRIEHHPRFPQGANVGFMQIVDRAHIRLRVFERGVGETLACGTGACAAVVVGRKRGLLEPEVRVDLPGGSAHVAWPGPGNSVWPTGPAVTVFSGTIDIQ